MTAICSMRPIAQFVLLLFITSFHLAQAQSTSPDATNGTKSIRQIVFSPDGQLLAVAIGEPNQVGRLAVWERQARRFRFIHQEPAGVCNVSFSPNGKFVAIGIFGPTAKLLSPVTGEVLREFRGHEGHVRSVAFVTDDLLATGSYDRTVRLWETATAKELAKLGEHNSQLRDIAASPDGKWLISGATSPDVRLWSIAERKQMAEFQPSNSICPTVGFSRDGTFFLTGRWDATLRIQETSTHTIRAAIRVTTARGFDLSPDNQTLFVCSDQPTISQFRLELFTPTKELTKRIDGLIATWQDDDYAKRERASDELISLGLVTEPQLREATKSAAAETRIRARRAREAVLSPKPDEVDVGHETKVGAVRFSPDGSLVASGDADGVVKLWDPNNGKVSTEFRVPELKTPQ